MRERDDERAGAERDAAIAAAADLGVAGLEFARAEQGLRERWPTEVTPHTVFWTLASEAALQALAEGNVRAVSMIHLWQAHWLARRRAPEWTRAARSFMQEHHVRGIRAARLTIVADSCARCRIAAETAYTPTDALLRMPIPNPDCELGACTCLWEHREQPP